MEQKQLSYVSGASDMPLLYKTIYAALADAVATWGDQDAVISCEQNIRLTYHELKAETDKLAAALQGLGLKAGDRLGIWSPNNVEWLLTQYATAALGIVLVNINPAYRLHELEYALDKVGCRALIMADKLKTSNYVAMMEELAPRFFGKDDNGKLSALEHVVVISESEQSHLMRFSDFINTAPLTEISDDLQPEDPINIQFTSGTTGSPKGATLSHHNILNNGFFVGRAMQLSSSDRICVPVPLYHCFGMVLGNLAAVTHGACVVYPAESFDPIATLSAISSEKCTALYGVPTMFVAMLAELDNDASPYDLSSLRTGIMAGAPCPVETMNQVIERMNMSEVTICYGMTETSPVSFQSSNKDSVENRVSTIGQVHPHLEVKIIDVDGKVLPLGEQGELCTRGYSVMQGYWGDAEKTAESIDAQGWMHTGDLATINAQGYAKITGRLKDMIIRGGENIYPLEIEEFFRTHADINDVAVFGVPDDKYGEIVAAWVAVKEGAQLSEQDLRDFCANQIAYYKVPALIWFVDEFPMTVTGKIQKFEMRKAMSEKLALQEKETA